MTQYLQQNIVLQHRHSFFIAVRSSKVQFAGSSTVALVHYV